MSKKIFFISVFLLLFAVSAQAKLIAYYPFEGNANDVSGNGLNGTPVGNPNYIPGKFGQAINLNGTSQYVDCGNPIQLQLNGQFTVMSWFKVDAWAISYQSILAKGDNSYRIARNGTGNTIQGSTDGLSSPYRNGTKNVNDGQWHHVALVFDGTNHILYIDGVAEATAVVTGTPQNSTYNLWIGANSQYPTASRWFDGLIDDVIIYDEGLSLAKITEIMNNSLSQGAASGPYPADAAIEVPLDVT